MVLLALKILIFMSVLLHAHVSDNFLVAQTVQCTGRAHVRAYCLSSVYKVFFV